MVEKWDPVLGPRDLQDLGTPRTSGTLWSLETPRTSESPGSSGPQDTGEIPSTKTQSQVKAENVVYLSEEFLFIEFLTMIISGKSPPFLPYSYNISHKLLRPSQFLEKFIEILEWSTLQQRTLCRETVPDTCKQH